MKIKARTCGASVVVAAVVLIGAAGRTLARHPSRRLSALGGAWLTRATAGFVARGAREPPHMAKQSPFARAGAFKGGLVLATTVTDNRVWETPRGWR